MIKVVLIVGHTQEKGGAINYLGESEYDFNSRIADQVKEIINKKYKSFMKVMVLKRRYGKFSLLQSEIRLFKPQISIELHFNSFSKKAYGCEILTYENAERADDIIRLADIITDRLQADLGVSERNIYRLDDDSVADGVKVLSEGRGVANLKYVHDCAVPYVMLLEPVFGNFATPQSKTFFEDEQKYVNFLVDVIGEDVQEYIKQEEI